MTTKIDLSELKYDPDLPAQALTALQDGQPFLCLKEVQTGEGTHHPGDIIPAEVMAKMGNVGKMLKHRYFIPKAEHDRAEAERIRKEWHNEVLTPATQKADRIKAELGRAEVELAHFQEAVKNLTAKVSELEAEYAQALTDLEAVRRDRPK